MTNCAAGRRAEISLRPCPYGPRLPDHGRCLHGTEVAAVERGRVGRAQEKQLRPLEVAGTGAMRSIAVPIHRANNVTATRYAVDAHDAVADTHNLRRHRTDALEQRNAHGQVAASRSKRRGRCLAGEPAQYRRRAMRPLMSDAIPADRDTVRGVVDQARCGSHERGLRLGGPGPAIVEQQCSEARMHAAAHNHSRAASHAACRSVV